MKLQGLIIVFLLTSVITKALQLNSADSYQQVLAPEENIVYAGRHGGSGASDTSFTFQTSADGSKVIQIDINDIICGTHSHRFSVTLDPGLPITGNRFSAMDIQVLIPAPDDPHSLNIDGVFFDADGDGTLEQALGGLSFVSRLSRCNAQWWATAVAPDVDRDGWGDTAERRLGSSPSSFISKPEHREVPTTSIYGPASCQDFTDNDSDGAQDGAEKDGPDADLDPDCMPPLQPVQPSPFVFAGRHGGAGEFDTSISFQTSADGSKVIQIDISDVICDSHSHRFSVTLDPGLPITGNRFSAGDIQVLIPAPHDPHSLDIDGVFFDADGDGTLEQALGGLSFVSRLSRCNVQWWATAVAPDVDRDGWGDTAERRLGSKSSSYGAFNSKPEHRDVPATSRFGPDVCHDFTDNDDDQLLDQDDPGCAELKNIYIPIVLKNAK